MRRSRLTGSKGSTVFYDMMVDSQRLVITIEEAPCNDAMSGEAFPRSVAVTIGRERCADAEGISPDVKR